MQTKLLPTKRLKNVKRWSENQNSYNFDMTITIQNTLPLCKVFCSVLIDCVFFTAFAFRESSCKHDYDFFFAEADFLCSEHNKI